MLLLSIFLTGKTIKGMKKHISKLLLFCLITTAAISSAQVSIQPSPAQGKAILNVNSSKDETIYYEIMDVAGMTSIILRPYRLNKGNNRISLNIASLPVDSYAVRVFGAGYNEILKFKNQ
jgi:hypothetical protein